jgi:hypothetical protein
MMIPGLSDIWFPLLALALAGAGPSGPTVAVEDTMRTELPEVLVRAPRVTLDEILDRVARGEARRDSLLRTQAFTAAVRVLHRPRDVTPSEPPRLYEESVWRVYKRRPDQVRTVHLRHRQGEAAKRRARTEIRADFSPQMSEEIVTFAFTAAARRDYRYRIEGRDLAGDHLIYRIAFEPRSPLDPFRPSGRVWVDTNEFVIVRQEAGFERSPMPMLIRRLGRLIVERRRAGGTWVLARVLMSAELTVPMPRIGRSVELALLYDDYAINQDLPDSLFAGARHR